MKFELRDISGADVATPEVDAARGLFREYGLFLQATQTSGYFSHKHFLDEIAALPVPYTSRRGGLSLAYAGSVAVGCIAYRINAYEGPDVCEIKRLYVRPAARGHGLARLLVTRALAELQTLGYGRVTLDTDVETMPGARELYMSFGFVQYKAREGSIAFLDRSLEAPYQPCGSE